MSIKKRIYVDMDDVMCDFSGAQKAARERSPEQMWPQAELDFFRGLKPIKDGIPSIHNLDKNFDVWFLTKPSVLNLMCYTEKALWIRDHMGQEWLNKLILCPDKSLVKGDYLIDDTPWPDFEGKQLLFGSDEFPDWKTVIFKLNWEIDTI
jgi:5'(3')-deoxyribonucleotidase